MQASSAVVVAVAVRLVVSIRREAYSYSSDMPGVEVVVVLCSNMGRQQLRRGFGRGAPTRR
jgi:hypothetical protein